MKTLIKMAVLVALVMGGKAEATRIVRHQQARFAAAQANFGAVNSIGQGR